MKYKILFSFIICLLALSCDTTDENEAFNFIDLSIKHKIILNSIRIEHDGKAIVLVNTLHREPKLYEVEFSYQEMNHIKRSIAKIQWSKCDSLSNYSMDGTQYIFILDKNDKTIKYLSGACDNSKEVDALIFYIEDSYMRKVKKDFYNSINGLIPPPPPIMQRYDSLNQHVN